MPNSASSVCVKVGKVGLTGSRPAHSHRPSTSRIESVRITQTRRRKPSADAIASGAGEVGPNRRRRRRRLVGHDRRSRVRVERILRNRLSIAVIAVPPLLSASPPPRRRRPKERPSFASHRYHRPAGEKVERLRQRCAARAADGSVAGLDIVAYHERRLSTIAPHGRAGRRNQSGGFHASDVQNPRSWPGPRRLLRLPSRRRRRRPRTPSRSTSRSPTCPRSRPCSSWSAWPVPARRASSTSSPSSTARSSRSRRSSPARPTSASARPMP